MSNAASYASSSRILLTFADDYCRKDRAFRFGRTTYTVPTQRHGASMLLEIESRSGGARHGLRWRWCGALSQTVNLRT